MRIFFIACMDFKMGMGQARPRASSVLWTLVVLITPYRLLVRAKVAINIHPGVLNHSFSSI